MYGWMGIANFHEDRAYDPLGVRKVDEEQVHVTIGETPRRFERGLGSCYFEAPRGEVNPQ
jgi:hypothetical protein